MLYIEAPPRGVATLRIRIRAEHDRNWNAFDLRNNIALEIDPNSATAIAACRSLVWRQTWDYQKASLNPFQLRAFTQRTPSTLQTCISSCKGRFKSRWHTSIKYSLAKRMQFRFVFSQRQGSLRKVRTRQRR
eukprot:1381197-Pleurochrysis_carterae.AAC.1